MEWINAGDRAANTYVYPIETGWVMVDTGREGSLRAVRERLRRQGVELHQLRYVFLTHARDNSAGFLRELLNLYPDLLCIASPQSWETLRRGRNPRKGGFTNRLALLWGRWRKWRNQDCDAFPPFYDDYHSRIWEIGPETQSAIEEQLGGKLLITPGHSRDAVSLLVGDRLYCGDAAGSGLFCPHHISAWVEDPATYAASWEAMAASGAKWIVPGCGSAFPVEELRNQQEFLKNLPQYNIFA